MDTTLYVVDNTLCAILQNNRFESILFSVNRAQYIQFSRMRMDSLQLAEQEPRSLIQMKMQTWNRSGRTKADLTITTYSDVWAHVCESNLSFWEFILRGGV